MAAYAVMHAQTLQHPWNALLRVAGDVSREPKTTRSSVLWESEATAYLWFFDMLLDPLSSIVGRVLIRSVWVD